MTNSDLPPNPPSRRFKIVVSDFHLGKGRHYHDGSPNILEDFIYDKEFAEFLTYYRSGEYASAEVELVLNGDILNTVQLDHYGVHTHLQTERMISMGLKQIIKGHPDFFSGLKKFAAVPMHKISYVIGNHDIGMMWPNARKIFSEACGAEVKFYETHYFFDGVHIEHGQQYEQFALTDLKRPFITHGLPEPVLNLPWGSLSVAVLLPKLKMERPHIDKVRPFQNFVKWAIIHDTFFIIKAAFMTAKFIFDTVLFQRRYQIKHGFRATMSLLKEVSFYPDYDRIAKKILEENEDTHTVIFGHTHILKFRQWREGKEYFNEGSWNEVTNLDIGDYGTRTRLTFAYLEYPFGANSSARPNVKLKEWKGVWRPEAEIVV